MIFCGQGKYYCLNCRKEFDEPEVLVSTYEDLYGISGEFYSKNKVEIEVCPHCFASDYIENKKYVEDDEEDEESKNDD